MQQKARPQPAAAAIDAGERGVQRRRPGGAALGPAAPEVARDAVDNPDAAALHQDKGGGGESGDEKAEQHRCRHPRLRLQPDEPGQPERGVGELGDEFEGHIDDRARRGKRPRHARQRQGAGAEHIARRPATAAAPRSPNREPAAPRSTSRQGRRAARRARRGPSRRSWRDGSRRSRQNRRRRSRAASAARRRPRNSRRAPPSPSPRQWRRGSAAPSSPHEPAQQPDEDAAPPAGAGGADRSRPCGARFRRGRGRRARPPTGRCRPPPCCRSA